MSVLEEIFADCTTNGLYMWDNWELSDHGSGRTRKAVVYLSHRMG